MAVDYILQYRIKGTTAWTDGVTGVSRDVNNEMITTVSGLTFSPPTTYEFRWQRIVNGSAVGHSNVVEALLQDVSTIPAYTDSSTLNGSGTSTLTVGSNETTVVRTAAKVVLKLSANWEYVAINLASSSGAPVSGNYYVRKTGSSPLAGHTLNSSAIVKTSNKSVDVLLDRTYTYSITIKFNGNSTGTIQVNTF